MQFFIFFQIFHSVHHRNICDKIYGMKNILNDETNSWEYKQILYDFSFYGNGNLFQQYIVKKCLYNELFLDICQEEKNV